MWLHSLRWQTPALHCCSFSRHDCPFLVFFRLWKCFPSAAETLSLRMTLELTEKLRSVMKVKRSSKDKGWTVLEFLKTFSVRFLISSQREQWKYQESHSLWWSTWAAGGLVLLVFIVLIVVSLVFLAVLAVAVGVFGFWGNGGGAGSRAAVAVGLPSAATTHRAFGRRLGPLCNNTSRKLPKHPVLGDAVQSFSPLVPPFKKSDSNIENSPEQDTCSSRCRRAYSPPGSPGSCAYMCLELHEKLKEGKAWLNLQTPSHADVWGCEASVSTHGAGSSRIWSSVCRTVCGRSAGSVRAARSERSARRCWACIRAAERRAAAALSALCTWNTNRQPEPKSLHCFCHQQEIHAETANAPGRSLTPTSYLHKIIRTCPRDCKGTFFYTEPLAPVYILSTTITVQPLTQLTWFQ